MAWWMTAVNSMVNNFTTYPGGYVGGASSVTDTGFTGTVYQSSQLRLPSVGAYGIGASGQLVGHAAAIQTKLNARGSGIVALEFYNGATLSASTSFNITSGTAYALVSGSSISSPFNTAVTYTSVRFKLVSGTGVWIDTFWSDTHFIEVIPNDGITSMYDYFGVSQYYVTISEEDTVYPYVDLNTYVYSPFLYPWGSYSYYGDQNPSGGVTGTPFDFIVNGSTTSTDHTSFVSIVSTVGSKTDITATAHFGSPVGDVSTSSAISIYGLRLPKSTMTYTGNVFSPNVSDITISVGQTAYMHNVTDMTNVSASGYIWNIYDTPGEGGTLIFSSTDENPSWDTTGVTPGTYYVFMDQIQSVDSVLFRVDSSVYDSGPATWTRSYGIIIVEESVTVTVDFTWTQPSVSGAANMVFADSISRTEVRAASHGLTNLLNSETTIYTYSPINAPEYFTVPSGVYEIEVTAYGGNGAADPDIGPNHGMGGFMQCMVPVVPGEVLQINVGGNGGDGSMTAPPGPPIGYTNYVEGDAGGGWNGGGHGGHALHETQLSGGGGGATDIRRGSYSLAERLVVAGGGGGAGRVFSSGAGAQGGSAQYPDATGGTIGATLDNASGTIAAGGGTQSVGGVGGSDSSPFLPSAPSGALGQGGNGQGRWYYDGAFISRGEYCGGGGGGGWYGGGGGTGTSNAGGAGSNGYLASAGVTMIDNAESTARTVREEPMLIISATGQGSRFYRSYIPYVTADAIRVAFAVLGNYDNPGSLTHDDGDATEGVASATVYVYINQEQIYQFHIYTDDIKLCTVLLGDGTLYTEGPPLSMNVGDTAVVELFIRKYDAGLAENKITVVPQSIVIAPSTFLNPGSETIVEERDMLVWPYRLFPPGIS